MTEDRLVDDDTALPANRILSAWIGKLQEVVIIGIDAHGELVAASTCGSGRAIALLGKGVDEINTCLEEA